MLNKKLLFLENVHLAPNLARRPTCVKAAYCKILQAVGKSWQRYLLQSIQTLRLTHFNPTAISPNETQLIFD